MRKSTPNPDIKLFIEYAYEAYRDKFHDVLYINGRCAKTVQRLIGVFGLEKLQDKWDRFLELSDEDDFIANAGCSIPVFESCINKLSSGKRKKASNLDLLMEDSYDTAGSEKDNVVPIRRLSEG